jgi:sugar/nucleoside kinase (ribokinase family)
MDPGSYLLCIGLTTVDVVALPVHVQHFDGVRLIKTLQMAPAGTAAGTALVAARLKVPTQLAGAVGADAAGRFVRGELQHAGVEVSLLQTIATLPTSSTLIPIDASGSRMIHHAPGAAAHMDLTAPLKSAAARARVVHYAAVGARNFTDAAALLAEARRAGALITCDLIAPGAGAAEELRRLLPHIDVFMPSAIEACFLTGESDLERAARTLKSWGAGACVIKNGAEGAMALDRDGMLTKIAAVPVAHVVDTTSCGDSFCAGFIAATMRGRPWRQALQFAAASASLVAQGPATLGALESFEQADALCMANYGT